jgi:hypothetical protein
MKDKLAVPEYQIALSKPEIEQILLDTHNHLAVALAYRNDAEKYYIPDTWLRRRIMVLRNLVAKLELLLKQNNENETRTTDTTRGDHSQ